MRRSGRMSDGGPDGPDAGDGLTGITTGVWASAYRLAGAAQQRMVAGIFLFFYALHCYAALGGSEVSRAGRSSASRADDLR
jgi:hypothetical protein